MAADVADIGSAFDVARAERDAYLQQRDAAIGQYNIATERIAQLRHRLDMLSRPAAGTSERLLLFLHLAKTGGVTLSAIFARNLEPREFLVIDMKEVGSSSIGTWSHHAVENALGRMKQSEIESLRFVWGHYREGIQAHLPKPCAVVTMLREPVDRVVSGYYYSDGKVAKSGESIDDYLCRQSHTPVWLDNYMTRVLSGDPLLHPVADPDASVTVATNPCVTEAHFEAALRTIDNCLVVGADDQFDEVLLVLGSDLGWSLSDLLYKRLNVTSARPAIADLAPETRQTLAAWNELDSALVAHGKAHLARRIRGYPGDFGRDLTLFRELNARFQQGMPIGELRQIEWKQIVSRV